MATLATVTDIQNQLPNVSINESSVPNAGQVRLMIESIENEVRAKILACGAPWPTDQSSFPYLYVKQTVLEGVKNLVMRAIYALVGTTEASREIDLSYKSYTDHLADICDVARAVEQDFAFPAATNYPVVGDADWGPVRTGSFNQYTQALAQVDAVRLVRRRTGNLPWPLVG